jgi:hypothetical protein
LSGDQNSRPKVAIEIRPLDRQHVLGAFSCGETRIDNWLKHHAWKDQKAGKIRVYCATYPGAQDVIGYYSLTFTAWEFDRSREVVEPKHDEPLPLPAIYLPRVGVCVSEAGQGIGTQLIIDAFKKSVAIADLAAVTTLTLHAIHAERAAWYERLEFVQLTPGNPDLAMGIPLAKIKKALASA